MIPQPTPIVPEPGRCKRCGRPQAVSLAAVVYCPPCDREGREEYQQAVSAYVAKQSEIRRSA